MSKRTFIVDIDLSKNQLLNAVMQNLATEPAAPLEGQVYFNTTDNKAYIYANAAWVDMTASGGAGATDLAYTASATNGIVTSSTGDDATIPLANSAGAGTPIAGLMTPAQFDDLAEAVLASDIAATPSGSIINDDTMATASVTTLATSLSIKNYVDTNVAGALNYQGGYNATTNVPDLETPLAGVVKKGFTYTVTVLGDFFAEAVQVGDMIIAETDDPAALTDWTVVNKNIQDIVDASETAKGIIALATQAEVNTGTDTLKAITPATLKSNLGVTATLSSTLKYVALIGNGVSTSIAVTHSIGEQFVTAQVFNTSTNEQVECEVSLTSATVTTFNFNTAPTTNEYRVVIIG